MSAQGGPTRAARVSPWLLPALMLAGAAVGLTLGASLGPRWGDPSLEGLVLVVRLIGVVFLALLKALIVPLVVTSIVVSVAKMGNLRTLGRLAGVTGLYFLGTTFLAVLTGMLFVNLLSPGTAGVMAAARELTAAQAAKAAQSPAQAVYDVVVGMFPPNLIHAAAEGNILGLIVFSMLFGAMVAVDERRGPLLVDVLDVANAALLRLVTLIVWLAPLGIAGLVADRIGSAGGGAAVWDDLRRLGWYAVTVLLGLGLHAFVTLPAVLLLLARRSPWIYLGHMSEALVTAFGTASSAATMGVTIECAVDRGGVSRRAADFVVPLGTTVNMNGTALYEAVAVMFIAQVSGLPLGPGQQLVLLVTATLAAVGAAAIPEAGLVTMVLVLSAVGLPAEGVGLILSIDWILDRFRTAVNVWGDAVGAAVVDRGLSGG